MALVLENIGEIVTCEVGKNKFKRGAEMREIGLIKNASIKIDDGKILKISTSKIKTKSDDTILDCNGKVVFPGFVDSHTHLVFAGSREDEFALRAEGKTYEKIAKSGGGILSTVKKTRESTKKELKKNARHYLNQFLRHGTTTVEIKSGYGLDFETEIKMLEVIRELEIEELISIVPTFLGAHAIPPEFKNKKNEYIDLIKNKMLPYVAKKNLAKFCDVFCERNYFSLSETKEILLTAKTLGMEIKLHAEELSNLGGAELAAELNATSVDHLEQISAKGIAALKKSNTIAVMLPGVSFNLNHQYAPARKLIDENIAVAISTDFNPGSCMSYSMPMMMTIASTQMKMSVEETISASTINGAAALGISNKVGSIEIGKNADLIIFDIPNYKFLNYHFGENHLKHIIKDGVILDL